MPTLDKKLLLIWEGEGGAVPDHRPRGARSGSIPTASRPDPTVALSREDDAATRRPPVPQTNPYSEELVKVIGVFHDPQAARQAKAELLAADLPVGGVRIEPVGLVQDLTPPSFYNPRGGLWDRLKHRLRGRPAPDRSTDDLSPDARVMVTVVPEAHARRVAAIQARHGALDAAPYLKWLPPRAPRGRRSARPRTPAHAVPAKGRLNPHATPGINMRAPPDDFFSVRRDSSLY